MTDHRGFAFGSFVLDTESHVLWRGPEVVPLTPKAAGLLEALLEKEGDVVAKAALIGRVWPDTVVEEANLSVTISALRRVLGLREDGTDWVETVSRRGYRFRGPVRTLGATRRLALAVLPLRSLGAAEGHLGLGMADALINRLVPLPGLLVRPIGAVLRYADHGADPAVKADRRLVPVKRRPLEAPTAAAARDARDVQQQRAPVSVPAQCGTDVEVFQPQTPDAQKSGEIVEVHRKSRRRLTGESEQYFRPRMRAEQRFT